MGRVGRLNALSKKRATASPQRLAYVQKVSELSRRGDMSAVDDLMKEYFSDKKAHPWHSLYKDIEKYWTREYPKKDVKETLILLRDAVFSVFDILSLSIALEVPTSDLVDIFTKESNWDEARRKVRNRCIELVEELIQKRKTRYLIPSALKREGLGFLVSRIESTELETFKKAKPKMKLISKKKKVLDLTSLEKSRIGSQFLREQMVMETQIDSGDPRVSQLLEAYDQFLLDLEIDMSVSIPESVPTEQITLNGSPIEEIDEEKPVTTRRVRQKSVQPPLSDFIEEKKTVKKKPRKTKVQKKGRAKKK
jgi:hypothetical protein